MDQKAALASLCLGFALTMMAAMAPPARDVSRMDDELCRKLDEAYTEVREFEREQGRAFEFHLERLSYLVLAAGHRSSGSPRLDAIFSKIQKQSPTLAVPRCVMSPAELSKFLDDLATDDANGLAYSAYLKKARTMSEFIDAAKAAITKRSGFTFDPSVRTIRSQ